MLGQLKAVASLAGNPVSAGGIEDVFLHLQNVFLQRKAVFIHDFRVRLSGIPDMPRLIADAGDGRFIKGIPHNKAIAPALQVHKTPGVGFRKGAACKVGDVYIQSQTSLMLAGSRAGNKALYALGILLFFLRAEGAFDQQLFFIFLQDIRGKLCVG